jgi:hypothetical protein
MSIIRVKKEREYVSIANAILQNKDLSWEARGVMGYLLSKPDGWECRNYDLVKQGPAGKHVIQRVMKELRAAGYIHRYQKSDGHKIEWITEIYETPELNTTSRNTDIPPAEEPTDGSSEVGESGDIESTDSQKVLISESTDFSGNSQNQKPNGSAKNSLSPEKKADLNTLAHYVAEIKTNDITTKEALRAITLLSYEVAQICKLDIALTGIANLKAIARITLALNTKGVKMADLKLFSDWWYNKPWQGKNGQAPTPAQLGDMWGQFEAQKVISVPEIDTSKGFYV